MWKRQQLSPLKKNRSIATKDKSINQSSHQGSLQHFTWLITFFMALHYSNSIPLPSLLAIIVLLESFPTVLITLLPHSLSLHTGVTVFALQSLGVWDESVVVVGVAVGVVH